MQTRYQSIPESDEDFGSPSQPQKHRSSFSCIVFSLVVVAFVALAVAAATLVTFVKPPPQVAVSSKSPISVYQTSSDHGDRMTLIDAAVMLQRGLDIPNEPLAFGNIDCHNDPAHRCKGAARIVVSSAREYQLIVGFGGAFTEASAINYHMLPEDVQDKFMELYFGKDGIGYSMGRVHINSCDFSRGEYDFAPVVNDFKLEHFDYTVARDAESLIPLIQTAMKLSQRPIKMLASPWSPPAWMKEPFNVSGLGIGQSMTGSAEPNGLINSTSVQNAWADYIMKWIDSYGWQGIPMWGITVQNEPKFAAPWEALKMTDEFQRDFVHDFLGPQLDHNHPEVKLFIFDHNKNSMSGWVDTVMKRKGNQKYVAGVAFHWYSGYGDRQMDGTYGYDEVNRTYQLVPDKLLLASEGCSCPDVKLGDWHRAERFAHDVIFDILNFASGWIDWNLLLDSKGGPNHLLNYCDAPIVVTEDFSDIYLQPKYYYMGHFSKYIAPDSRRIASTVVGNYKFEKFDPRVRSGFEAGMYACEKSPRQVWKLTTLGLLALVHPSEQDNTVFELCVASGGLEDRPFVRMVYCSVDSYSQPMKVARVGDNHLMDSETGLCFGLAGDSVESGTLLEVKPCDPADARQRFVVDPKTGEVKAEVGDDLCLTAGWPFLSGIAVTDGVDSTSIVVMNEAPVDTEVVLHDAVRDQFALLGINARSIQTIVYK
jgi:glucosylceramidase